MISSLHPSDALEVFGPSTQVMLSNHVPNFPLVEQNLAEETTAHLAFFLVKDAKAVLNQKPYTHSKVD